MERDRRENRGKLCENHVETKGYTKEKGEITICNHAGRRWPRSAYLPTKSVCSETESGTATSDPFVLPSHCIPASRVKTSGPMGVPPMPPVPRPPVGHAPGAPCPVGTVGLAPPSARP